jgi:hypothetical protein
LSDIGVEPISAEAASALLGAFDMISYFFVESEDLACDRFSPFLSHFLYSTASVYLKLKRITSGETASNNLGVLKQALRLLNSRWLAAGRSLLCYFSLEIKLTYQKLTLTFLPGVYLTLLENQEILLISRDIKE